MNCKNPGESCSQDSDCCSGSYCSRGEYQPDGTWSAEDDRHCCQTGKYWDGATCQTRDSCSPTWDNEGSVVYDSNLNSWKACCPCKTSEGNCYGDPEGETSNWEIIVVS